MVSTVVEICNMALARLGDSRISDIDADEEKARLCKLFYTQTRDEVLREHPWTFATGRAILAAISGTNLTGFDYRYQLPVDCLYVRNQIDAEGETYTDITSNYKIEGREIHSDLSPCAIKYTKKIDDPAQFDSQFVEALALKLASKLAVKLSGKQQLEAGMIQQYLIVLQNAKGLDGDESQQQHVPETFWSEYN